MSREVQVFGILEDGKFVEVTPDKVKYVETNIDRNGEEQAQRETVINAGIRITKKYKVDGNTFFKIKYEDEKILNMHEMQTMLRYEGIVLEPHKLETTLAMITSNIQEKEVGQSTYGIYPNEDGELEICLNPIPITDEQRNIWEQKEIKKKCRYSPTKRQVEKYIEFSQYYHKYEFLPVFGLAIMAPFTPVIKPKDILIPIPYLWSKERNVGKSAVMKACTKYLYGIPISSSDQIRDSSFRFNELMNSACLPRAFDEGEGIKFDKMVAIREALENWELSSRGNPDQTHKRYYARALPIFTGNKIGASRPETLKRLMVVHFDEERRKEENYKENQKEVSKLLSSLKEIGYGINEYARDIVKTEEDLLNKIDKIEEELNTYFNFDDAVKPTSWAISYLGLVFFSGYCKTKGIEWKPPSIKKFCDEVISNVEASTWENQEKEIDVFRDWLSGWMEKRKTSDGGIKGYGQIFKEDTLVVTQERKIQGYWITNTILQDYKGETQRKDLPKINNLKELAQSVSTVFDIPLLMITDKVGGKRRIIGDKVQATTFIPIDSQREEEPLEETKESEIDMTDLIEDIDEGGDNQ